MTDFFAYDRLSWPEVSALPRDIPLILPLGEGYSLDRLASALGSPPRSGILPAFPFGWESSGLVLAEHILGVYLVNLLDSLREDGFTHVYALTPQGIDLGLGANRIVLPKGSGGRGKRNGEAGVGGLLPPDKARGKVILLPIGHTEQHGHHLPLCVDTLIIEAIVIMVLYWWKLKNATAIIRPGITSNIVA